MTNWLRTFALSEYQPVEWQFFQNNPISLNNNNSNNWQIENVHDKANPLQKNSTTRNLFNVPIVEVYMCVCVCVVSSFCVRCVYAYNCINSYRSFSFSSLSLRHFTFSSMCSLFYTVRNEEDEEEKKVASSNGERKRWLTDWPPSIQNDLLVFFLLLSKVDKWTISLFLPRSLSIYDRKADFILA